MRKLLLDSQHTEGDLSAESTKYGVQKCSPLVREYVDFKSGCTPKHVRNSTPADMSRHGDMRFSRLKIAFYSHDTMGLGHIRRSLLIAQTLVHSNLHADILMIAGTYKMGAFAMPPGVDCLTLPALYKEENGRYRSRGLGISLEELITLRANAILAALKAFEPDVLIVDNVPRGAVRELDLTLEYLHLRGHTRCILGMREILDEPSAVEREWHRAANEDAIKRYYDAVWIYGDPIVYDMVREYSFSPDVAAKVKYTGYLDQRMRLKFVDAEFTDSIAALALPPGKLFLCLVGGGQDGARLAEAFAEADLPSETSGVIVTGPFMPQEAQKRLRQRAMTHSRLRVVEFVPEPTLLLNRADRVIAMGGYGTLSEVLSFDKPALVVPRVKPRREQLIRAERLRELGLIDVLYPDEVDPHALTKWLALDNVPSPKVRNRIDMNGLARLPLLLEEILTAASYSAQDQIYEGRNLACF